MFYSFILGGFTAKWSGAVNGQGLAGGAIVLFYGLIATAVGLVFAFYIVSRSKESLIKRLNIILTVIFILIVAFYSYRYFQYKTLNPSEIVNPPMQTKLPPALNIFPMIKDMVLI
ncbi:hypothetical protein GCM10025777_09030 [Membranihabitans marinus]